MRKRVREDTQKQESKDIPISNITDIDEEEVLRREIKWFLKMNPAILGLRFHDMHPITTTKMKSWILIRKRADNGIKAILTKHDITGLATLDYYNFARSLLLKLRRSPRINWERITDALSYYYITVNKLKPEIINELAEFIIALVTELQKAEEEKKVQEFTPYVPKKPLDINNPDIKVEPVRLSTDAEEGTKTASPSIEELIRREQEESNNLRNKLMKEAVETHHKLKKIEESFNISLQKIMEIANNYNEREKKIMDLKFKYSEPLSSAVDGTNTTEGDS